MAEIDTSLSEEGRIKEEYQLWRKNCRYMYSFVSETALTWPSLTVQWLPQYKENKEERCVESKLLLGTHTSGEDTNYVKVASTQLPFSKKEGSSEQGADNGKKASSAIKITKKFANSYEVNRCRYMPQEPQVAATINGEGEIDIYDLDGDKKTSVHHITTHDANGYGLCWNPLKKGHLLTSSDDKTAAVTDISNGSPTTAYRIQSHNDIVNDAKWSPFNENVFGSVSDDKYLHIFDLRESRDPVMKAYVPDSGGINTLSFSQFSPNLVATGNSSSTINLIDIRRLSAKEGNTRGLLHTMMGHADAITSLEFSPHNDEILGSGSQDRRLILWDLLKIGEEQTQEDAEDGCPELFMMHAGHTSSVMDFSWCPYRNWTIASVADDNIVHLWEVDKKLLENESSVDLQGVELE